MSDDTRPALEPIALNPVEAIFWRLERGLPGSFRVTTIMRVDGCVEADTLSAALQRLQGRHPKLRAAIVKKDGCLQFEFPRKYSAIPFAITDWTEGESVWREETRRLGESNFPAEGPLAAVRVLRNRTVGRSELLLTVHHSVADGLSAIVLMRELLAAYKEVETESHPDDPAVILPVTDVRVKRSGTWRDRLWLLRRFLRLRRYDNSTRQTMLPESTAVHEEPQWVHWTFSTGETLRLIRHCRREQTSVGGALIASVICALMDCLPLQEAHFKCTFPFDLRDALETTGRRPLTANDLGCFASIMNEYYDVTRHVAFWDVARRAHQNHHDFVRRGGPAFYYNLAAGAALYEKVARVMGFLSQQVPQKSEPRSTRVTLLATYYGVLDVQSQYGQLRPRECSLIFKNDSIGPSIVVEALVMGQRLNVGLAGGSLEPAFWKRLQQGIRSRLEEAIGGQAGELASLAATAASQQSQSSE